MNDPQYQNKDKAPQHKNDQQNQTTSPASDSTSTASTTPINYSDSPHAQKFKALQEMADNSSRMQEFKALQEMADNSPRMQEFKALQEMADNSPRMQEFKALQEMADNSLKAQEFKEYQKQTGKDSQAQPHNQTSTQTQTTLSQETDSLGSNSLVPQYPQVAVNEDNSQKETEKKQPGGIKADPDTAEKAEEKIALKITQGELTAKGEGSEEYIHWPNTTTSGVTLGHGYDIGSRTEQEVIDTLTKAGMSNEQAVKISKGAGKTGDAAKKFVADNKDTIGKIQQEVRTNLLVTLLEKYREKAKDIATNPEAKKDSNGYYYNAAGREEKDSAKGKYVLTSEEWDALHPVMVEFLTDLIYQGGFYQYDRVAQINKALKENTGDDLEQFKAVRTLFQGDDSYMDKYGEKVGLNKLEDVTVTFNSEKFSYKNKNNRMALRLAFLDQTIKALENKQAVELVAAASNETTTPGVNPNKKQSPASGYTAKAENYYTVQSGDSFKTIAEKFQVDSALLIQENRAKVKIWGNVQGFLAGEKIVVPGVNVQQVLKSQPKPIEKNPSPAKAKASPSGTKTVKTAAKQDPAIKTLAANIYNAINGLGTDEEAVYQSLATLNHDPEKIEALKKNYTALYGVSLEEALEGDFSWGEQDKALAYLKAATKARKKPAENPSQTAVAHKKAIIEIALSGSVGKGGENKAKDVLQVQSLLVALTYLSEKDAEVLLVQEAATQNPEGSIEGTALSDTIEAIKAYQKYGATTLASSKSQDGKVDKKGLTEISMQEMGNLINQYGDQEFAGVIENVLANEKWKSQFRWGANFRHEAEEKAYIKDVKEQTGLEDPADLYTVSDAIIKAAFEKKYKKNGWMDTKELEKQGLRMEEKADPNKPNFICCWDASNAMLKATEAMAKDKSHKIQTFVGESGSGELTKQAALGVKYIDAQLQAGKAVFVGLDKGEKRSINEGTTDHFVVIVGKHTEGGKWYYTYFNPGTAHAESKGTNSKSNRLYINDKKAVNDLIPGDEPKPEKFYTLAQIRINHEDKKN